MKTIKMVLGVLIVISLFASCSSDDDAVALLETVTMADLEGIWNVTNISGGFPGFDEDFMTGDLIWTFNENMGNLIIESAEGVDPIINTGTFTYSILQNGGRSFLVIDDIEQGLLSLSRSNLQLDEGILSIGPQSDSFQINFER